MLQTLPAGESAAQLLFLPLTDSNWESSTATTIAKELPMLTFSVAGSSIVALMDTGADVSVISQKDCPSQWVIPPVADAIGIGDCMPARQSANLAGISDPDKPEVTFSTEPCGMSIPLTLGGKGLPERLGNTLHTKFTDKVTVTLEQPQTALPLKLLEKGLQSG
ncbi:hypothetical protein JRQ81_012275 [Phrynocephalus forsythii]|uniref:Peptidase A2 domain-containing protein n=1 Tax=Phrynocephalus forsythii TaxID=171643 RepID=A0A9Q0X5M9_9SAUR|nr:hypothetical protein JRQ81_012275 [Phrynocephalus forsythii]